MIFKKDSNGILYAVFDDNEDIYKDNPEYLVIDDSLLPEAVFPYYKLDLNGNIIPDDTRIIEKAKDVKIKEINMVRDEYILNNFYWTHPTTNQVYHMPFTEEDQTNYTAIYIKAKSDPNFTTFYITVDNQTLELSNSDCINLGDSASLHKAIAIKVARELKDTVLASTNVDEILNADFMAALEAFYNSQTQ